MKQEKKLNTTNGINNPFAQVNFFQPKLSINQPDDIYEQEADAMADKVMRMNDTPQDVFFKPANLSLQKKCTHCEEEEKLQRKDITGENIIQREDKTTPEIPDLRLHASTDAQSTSGPDYLSMRQPFFTRNIPHLWDPNSALQVWQYNFDFFKRFGISDSLSTSLTNFTAPRFIDSQLKAGNPTWWEITDRELNTSTISGSIPVLDFNADFSPAAPAWIKSIFGGGNTGVQRKCAACEEEGKLSRKQTSSGNITASGHTENYISALHTRGVQLSEKDKNFFEPKFGYDFSNVKLHTDTEANKSAEDISALAYTHRNNIVFGQNQYQPDTSEGKKLLAHELTHVIQQSGSDVARKKIQRSLADIRTGMPAAQQQQIRSRITFWDVPIEPSGVSSATLNDYFKRNPPNASLGFSGTIVIDSSVTQTTAAAQSATFDVQRGLNNLPGHFVTTLRMPINTTATINLDLSPFGGQSGVFRVTHLNSNTGRGAATPEFHIEFVSPAHTTAAQASRPGSFSIGSFNFTAIGWPDARYDELIEVMNRMPQTALRQIDGMRFRYRSQLLQTITQLGEDGEAQLQTGVAANRREIIVWSSVTRPTVLNYNGFSRTDYVVAHEVGHWLDFNPVFIASQAATPAATDSASGYYRLTNSGNDLAENANRPTRFQQLTRTNTAGTTYGATDLKENFAEFFAMYVTDPTQLQLLRPAVYTYFHTNYP